ncbi:VanZ family protein [Streptomyces tanashiensis]|uniref:VanZ family protein n=1 Tax=Streptomyces tanashiensis TaxID=67367 RepID=UPI0036EECF9F
MFTAIFHDHYGYLAGTALAALALAGAAWWTARRLGSPQGRWWAGLAAAFTAMIGVTFMGSGPADGQCVINHDALEPFRTTQGLWNLAMTVPLGLFAMLAARRPLPVLVAVVALPLAVEFTQGSVDGLGRVCDSADAEMNILGGLAGAAVAALVLAVRGRVDWRAGVKAGLVAAGVLVVIGAGVARPLVSFTHLDGTGLSAADVTQRTAVEQAVEEAFGDRYELGRVYDQPCVGVPCTNVLFSLHPRGGAHPQGFADGTLSWPDKKRLSIEFAVGEGITATGFPVAGATAPAGEKAAYEAARWYMRAHYPWARQAAAHRTYPVGDRAELGWTTRWTWEDEGVLMPRALDVQVDRQGRVSRLDVTLGPTRLDLERPKVSAVEAERIVRARLVAQSGGRGAPDEPRFDAFALKAVERDGEWRAEWLVHESVGAARDGAAPPAPGSADILWVDAVSGDVHVSAFGTG